jgi:hypothetical protein
MSDPNDPRPLRVMVFPDRPDVLLIYVPEGQELWLPRLKTPFDRHVVAMALNDVDIDARVRESVPGRYKGALTQALSDHRSEDGSRRREEEAARAARVKTSKEATTYDLKRRELVEEKAKTDAQLRALKEEVGHTKAVAATTGNYMPVSTFRNKTDRIADLQNKSLAIQHQLGQLRRTEAAFNVERSKRREESFVSVAKEHLSKEEFKMLWDRVDVIEQGAKEKVS